MTQFFGLQQLVIDITLCVCLTTIIPSIKTNLPPRAAGTIFRLFCRPPDQNIFPRAGLASEYNQTCANEQPNAPTPQGAQHNCYVDNVWGPGSPRYDDAYFEISNIRAYTTGVPNPMQTLSPSPTSGSSAGAVTVNINGTAVTVQPNTEIPNANLTSGGARTLAFWSRSGIVAVFMGLVMFYW